MLSKEKYQKESLSQNIFKKIQTSRFRAGYIVKPVIDNEMVQQINKSSLEGMDYRTRIEPDLGFASVFEGLAFDPNRLRSQAFALYQPETQTPIGLMTTIIAPSGWVEQQRYIKREFEGVRICDFSTINNANPNFLIIPAWTKIDPAYLVQFAIPGFRMFNTIMSSVYEAAPEHTWIEIIAKGQWPDECWRELAGLAVNNTGTFIPNEELPFEPGIIGKHDEESSSSVKMAVLMRLRRIPNVGSANSLGPVFSKRIR